MSVPRDPEEVTAGGAPAVAEVPAETRMGAVHLTVADLGRSLEYYRWALGLVVREQGGGRASLGAEPSGGEDRAEDLLVLTEQPGARPARGYCGLYHYALLVPERVDLARWLIHAARERVPLVGLSDHFVSEAIYLQDPDDHGIEIYWDRPRELWEGQVERMGTWALDIEDLLRTVPDAMDSPFDGMPAGTRMGHTHLRVADVDRTVAFYRDVLGFDLMTQLGPQAAFLSAGGYHHHIGANVWESRGAPPPPPGTAALQYAEIVLPDEGARAEVLERVAAAGLQAGAAGDDPVVTDPSGNRLLLALAAA
jgi:catechol 2,3-dioxygenase